MTTTCTGGTLVRLVAATTDRFRAVFSFGPADDVSAYPEQFTAAVNLLARAREVVPARTDLVAIHGRYQRLEQIQQTKSLEDAEFWKRHMFGNSMR